MANKLPHPWSNLARKYRLLRQRLPKLVSNIALNEFKDNFRREGVRTGGGGVDKWAPRKRSKNARDSRRGVLTQTGRMKRSMRARPSHDIARVVSDDPKAPLHNEGGQVRGTQRVRAHTRRGRRVKAHRRRVNFSVPARPFMVTTDPLMEDIEKKVFDELEQIFKEA